MGFSRKRRMNTITTNEIKSYSRFSKRAIRFKWYFGLHSLMRASSTQHHLYQAVDELGFIRVFHDTQPFFFLCKRVTIQAIIHLHSIEQKLLVLITGIARLSFYSIFLYLGIFNPGYRYTLFWKSIYEAIVLSK